METLNWKPRKNNSERAPNWRGGAWYLCKREGCGNRFYVSPCRRKNGRGRYCSSRCWNLAMPLKVRRIAMGTRWSSESRRREKGVRTRNYWERLPKKILEMRLTALGKVQKCWGRFLYRGKMFRSTWEVAFAKWLSKNKVRYKYEAIRFKLPDGKHYLPDFYLQDYLLFVEVKSYWWKNQLEKFVEFIKVFKDVAICVLDRTYLKELGVLS